MKARFVVLLIALLFVPAVSSQDPHEFDPDGYSFRGVLGDDPRTTAEEDADLFSVHETFPVVNDGTDDLTEVRVFLPRDADLVTLAASNGTLQGTILEGDVESDGQWLTYRYPGNESVAPGASDPGFTFRYTLPAADPADVRLTRRGIPLGLPSYSFLVLVPNDVVVRSEPPMQALDFEVYEGFTAYMLGESPGDSLSLELAPAGGGEGDGGADLNWLLIGIAFVAGAVIAYGLAKMRGPARPSRAETMAGRTVADLEARKRVLMASLKELELAHRSGEIPSQAYNPLKAELKGETVKVMTELEKRQAAPPAPTRPG